MFTEIHIWLIVGMSLLSGFTPGPGALAIAGTAMARGHRHGFAVAYGMTAGAAIWAIVAGAGLGAVLIGNQWLFETLKYVGAAYLIWLSYRSAKSALIPNKDLVMRQTAGKRVVHSFIRGVLVHLTNPKVLFYWSSIFVVAIKPGAPSSAILGVIIVSLSMNVLIVSTWALVFSRQRVMNAYAKARRWIEGASAGLFGGAAVFVVTRD